MSLGIDVWTEFGGFLVPKWSQVGTKMGSNIDVYLEGGFFKNRALATAGARFFMIWGSKLGANIDQKSIKNGAQGGMHLGIDF